MAPATDDEIAIFRLKYRKVGFSKTGFWADSHQHEPLPARIFPLENAAAALGRLLVRGYVPDLEGPY